MELLKEALNGSTRSLAKLISLVENEGQGARDALKALYPNTGNAAIIGVTGPPGVGKSTLIGRLTEKYLERECSVGILAVDPSSEISGGSLLGDRIRMSHLAHDHDVYIRSLGSRGCLGGVSLATENVVRVLDAAGRDVIIVETVGVGQDECEVTHIAKTTLLVLAPGLGDDIQALKAGITELADIFVVNKSDQPGAENYSRMLRQVVNYSAKEGGWTPPVVMTAAARDEGVDLLLTSIDEHLHFLKNHADLLELRKNRLRKEIMRRVELAVQQKLSRFLETECDLEPLLQDIIEGRIDPYSGTQTLVNRFYKKLHERDDLEQQ